MLLEPGFADLLGLPGARSGSSAAGRGSSLSSHTASLWDQQGLPLGKLSLGRTLCWEISSSDVEGLGICEKKAKSCDSKGCCKRVCSGASFCDSLQCCKLWGEMGLGLTPLPVFRGGGGTRQQNAGLSSRGSARKDLMGPP